MRARSHGRVAFCKQYTAHSLTAGGQISPENLGHEVEYRGSAARLLDGGLPSLSGGVRGTWSIHHELGDQQGSWHVWPVMAPQDGAATSADGGGQAADDQAAESECCVCYDRRIDTALQPCGHVALCGQCAARLPQRRCPLCRAAILETVHIPRRR